LLFAILALDCCSRVWGASNEDHSDASSSSNDHGSHSESGHHPEETLIFLFGAIFIGTCVMHLTTLPALANLPITVVLFVLGVIFALMAEYHLLDPFGMVVRSYNSWVAIDPHLLLFTFLPALLCGDAMTIDTHIAKRTIGQCLILAGPGVVIGSFATAGLVYAMLPYGWDFWTCLTVGSILAATDPVAVVSLLKDLGASPVLTMQIQGESLLNDGTAIVLFNVAYAVVGGEDYGAGRVIAFTLQSTLGASALGAAIGLGFYIWIRSASDKLCHSSPIIQISLTLLCAYWSFIFAEGVLHISGVLSTVAAAAVLAHMMWPVVVERRSMLETWHVIETVGNTMVFFLAGVLTGRSMLNSGVKDYLWTVLIYTLMIVLRFVMFLILRPLLNLVGQPISFPDLCVMTWGGLRGMVGLALAILVRQDRAKGRLSEHDGERILFLVSGVAALTLIVNATTSPAVCKFLGITQAPECRKVLVRNIAQRAEEHVGQVLEDLAANRQTSEAVMMGFVREAVEKLTKHIDHDLSPHKSVQPTTTTDAPTATLPDSSNEVRRLSTSSRRPSASWVASWLVSKAEDANVEALWAKFDSKRMELLRTGATVEVFQFGKQLVNMREILERQTVDLQQLKMVREVFLEAVRASYWEQLRRGRFLVGSSEPAILLNSVNLAKDKSSVHLSDWMALAREVSVPDEGDPATGVRCSTASGGLAEPWWIRRQFNEWRIRRHFSRQMRAVQVIDAFIEAHRKAQTQIASYFGEDATVDTAEETWVVIESQIEIFEAAIARSKIAKSVQLKVNTMWRVHLVAEEYRNFVISTHESGILQVKEAEMLLHPIAHVMQELRRDRKQLKLALQREKSMAHKTSHLSKLTRVDAAQRIQRTFRQKQRQKELRVAVERRRSTLRFAPTLKVENVDDSDDNSSTNSGEDLAAIPISDVDQNSGDNFLSVLPHSANR